MKIYLKRYEKNIDKVYDMTEFYNPDGSMKVEGLDFVEPNDFKADDGVTSLLIDYKKVYEGPEGEKNYIMIPSISKIYSIQAYVYINTEVVELLLEENYLLSNYNKAREFNYVATRAFPYNKDGRNVLGDAIAQSTRSMDMFPTMGHDISPVIRGTRYKTTQIWGSGIKTKVALLFFKVDGNQSIKMQFTNKEFVISETFYTMNDLLAKYRNEFEEDKKYGQKSYADKLVKIVQGEDKGLYRFVTGIGWRKVSSSISSFEDVEIPIRTDSVYVYRNPVDVDVAILAIPFSEISSNKAITFDQFVKPIHGEEGKNYAKLIDIKIVDNQLFDSQILLESGAEEPYLDFHYSDYYYRTFVQVSPVDAGLPGVFKGVGIFHLKGISNELNISRSLHSLNEDFEKGKEEFYLEPFKEYYINVFGNRHKISPFQVERIKLIFSVTTESMSYQIVDGQGEREDKVVLYEGRLNNSVFFTTDEKDDFYSQNPLFRTQMNTNLASNSIKSMIGGAAMGSIVPGVGTLIGAGAGFAAGAAGSLFDAGMTHRNKELSDKTMEMRPDIINGKMSDTIDISTITDYGIYWITYTNDVGVNQMKLEYFTIGMPIVKYIKVKDSFYNIPENTIFKDPKYMYVCGEVANDTGGLREVASSSISATIRKGVFIKDYKEV